MLRSSHPTLATLLLGTAILALLLLGFFLMPNLAEANHCGSNVHHPDNNQCYTAESMCDVGWTEYCSQAASQPPASCPSGQFPDAAGNCFTASQLCSGGYTQYCSGGSTGGGGTSNAGHIYNDPAGYRCPEAAAFANNAGALSQSSWSQQYNYIKTIYCNSTDVCPNLPGDQPEIPNNYIPDFNGNCQVSNSSFVTYVSIQNGQTQSCTGAACNNGIPPCNGTYAVDPGGVHTCVPPFNQQQNQPQNTDPQDPNDPTTDVCPNLPGTQTSVPQGYTYQNGACVESTTGSQCTETRTGSGKGATTEVVCNCPTGYIQQGDTCVAEQQGDPDDPTQQPNDTTQPENDEPWNGRVFLIPVDPTANENGNTASFRVGRNGPGPVLDVGLTISGTATRGTDYTLLGGGIEGPNDATATIPTNQTTSGLIILTPLDDDIAEGTETVRPRIRDLANYNLGSPDRITLTIQDNDAVCSNTCLNGNVVTCTGQLVEECSFSCGSGICIPPPSPEIITWTVLPLLVHRGDEVTLTWNTDYTTGCTITRSNGASFEGLNTAGTRVDTITQETTYVLSCEGLDETTLTSPSKTVRIVPDWQEI